ncbi:MAG TPA: hypothetical protein VF735_05560 [Pyrinomonadaceae bacterium]
MLTIPERFYFRLPPSAFLLCCMLLMVAAGCQSQTGAGQPSPAPPPQQQQTSSQSTTVATSNGPPLTQNVSVQNSNTTVRATATTFDACSLLTGAEVSSVQGDEITSTQAAPGNSTRLAVSQCYYQAKTPSKSVSLEVTHRLSGQARALSPREYWEERFESAEHEKERGREGKGEAEKRKEDKPGARDEGEEEEGAPPQKIAGIGDEAFWAGNRVMGALYVLKGNTIVRISIGGVADPGVRLEKTKALARLALKRLKD